MSISPPQFKFSVSTLIKQGRIEEDDLQKMLGWIKEENDLPNCGEQMMCLFLMACQNKLDDTKKCIKAYYSVKRDAPELFDNRDMSRDDMRHQLQNLEFIVLPERTEEGYVVIMHRLVSYYPSEYNMDVSMKILFMVLDAALYSDPPTGLIVLFDMRGVGIRHLTRIKLWAIRRFFTYVQEALTLQLKAIHVLNSVWFMDKVLNIIKPFYKPELLEMLHLHKSDLDMEKFYEKCIPKCCLPSDLGGNLETSPELHLKTWKQLEEMQEFFDQEEKLRHSIIS